MASVDTKATVGLRGLAALHVMMHHYLGLMTYDKVNINGVLELSTFFLLSGFCLALKCDEQGVQSPTKFFISRLTKLLPTYYIANILALLCCTFTVTNTWALKNIPFPMASPTWTISTMLAFYLLFPFILRSLQSLSSKMLAVTVVTMYQVQALPLMLLVHNGDGQLALFVTRHPLFRLPLFIMGVAAGLLSLRGVEYSGGNSGLLHHLSPWTCSESTGSSINEANPSVWASKTDRCSLVLIFLIIYSTVVSTFDLTLVVIVGLTKDEGKSILGRLCRSKFVQFLGHYSMATYMLHDSVEKIIILHVELEQDLVTTQICCIFLTFLSSILVTHLVEKPIYKLSSALLFQVKNEFKV